MTHWNEILKIAVIGTERQAIPLLAANDALGNVLSQSASEDRERTLLNAAAVTAIYQRAGRLPARSNSTAVVPCETEILRACNTRASQKLALLLNGQHPEFLSEWLTALAAANQRVSEERLPALLDAGAIHRELRPAIMPVLGKRGVWLARQNPEWNYVIDEVDEAAWLTGNKVARVSMLNVLRQSDPARARDLITTTWNEDGTEDRAAFVAELLNGLSLADEAFLESALDDRRKEVRKTAAELLARMPDSGLCQRMIERTQPLLVFKQKKLSKDKIEIGLPVACDKAMIRDGIEPKALSYSGIGEKSWWLQQMLSVVPPSIWCQKFNTTPAALLNAAQGEWRKLLIEAWSKAATLHRDADWIETLLSELIRKPDAFDVATTFSALPMEHQERMLMSLMQQSAWGQIKTFLWQFETRQFCWSETLSRAMVASLAPFLSKKKKDVPFPLWPHETQQLARHIHPAVTVEAMTILADAFISENSAADSLRSFLDILQFRYDMLREISE